MAIHFSTFSICRLLSFLVQCIDLSHLIAYPNFLHSLQRVLEADENGDGFHDDEDFEVDTPKRKHRNKGRVSDEHDSWKSVDGVKEKRQARARKWDSLRQGGLTPEREIKHEKGKLVLISLTYGVCRDYEKMNEKWSKQKESDYIM